MREENVRVIFAGRDRKIIPVLLGFLLLQHLRSRAGSADRQA
jgi:hypothetical protein